MKLKRSQLRNIILQEAASLIKEMDSTIDYYVDIDDDLDRCIVNKNIIEEFCEFCGDILNISEPIAIKIISNREKEGMRTTADYNPNNHLIRVYGKNRAIVDICRSIAHEMTHMGQMIDGRLRFPVQDAGGEIEDEANSKAGEIIKLFARSGDGRRAIYENFKKI